MMEIGGIRMLIGLVIGIALLIMLVLKTKVQTFLALIISTIAIGVIGGMPLTATDVVDAAGEARAGVSIINSITSGFGTTLGNIGIIIGNGTHSRPVRPQHANRLRQPRSFPLLQHIASAFDFAPLDFTPAVRIILPHQKSHPFLRGRMAQHGKRRKVAHLCCSSMPYFSLA